MIYVHLRSVHLPAEVANKRSHFAKGLADCLNCRQEEKFLGWNLFPELVTCTKNKGMPAMLPLNRSAAQ
jgi:hypothetical protein